MKVVWAKKDATVREVYETLRERRRIAYTTVMTMMNILETKERCSRSRMAAPSATARHSRSGGC